MDSVSHGDVVGFNGVRCTAVATDENGGIKVRMPNGLVLDATLLDVSEVSP